MATAPGDLVNWDITKLAGPAKSIYYDAYVMLVIFSRFIVGCVVHVRESAALADAFMQQVSLGSMGSPTRSTRTEAPRGRPNSWQRYYRI